MMQVPDGQNSGAGRPVEISRAVQLLYASLGIGVVKSVVDFARFGSGVSVALVLFIMVVTLGLFFIIIWKISDGRN
ncbi:MAG TPA: hypothetical protein VF621_14315, partial [Pyrinomonadaceae bacterium]